MYNKLCENTKNCKSAYPGSKKKLYMGPVNKNPKEKIQNLIFKYAKLDVCKKNFQCKKKKKILRFYVISKESAQ